MLSHSSLVLRFQGLRSYGNGRGWTKRNLGTRGGGSELTAPICLTLVAAGAHILNPLAVAKCGK